MSARIPFPIVGSLVLCAATASAEQPEGSISCEALEAAAVTPDEIRDVVSCANAETARQMNRNLPTQVDEITTLIGVVALGPRVVYSMRIDGLKEDYSTEELGRQEQRVRDNVCETPEMRRTIGYGGIYQYVWLDRQGRRMHSFAIDHCASVDK